MKIITVAATKGGTGKTATAGALAQAAARAGKRVLAVDCDPQANLSFWLCADLTRPGCYEMMEAEAKAENAIQPTKSGIDLMAGSGNLTTVRTKEGSAWRLQQATANLKQYDLILIDTPPGLGALITNGLYASNGLLIPLETDSNSLQGLYQIIDIAHHIQQAQPELKILGTILTKCDPRPKINRYMMKAIKEQGAAIGAPLLMVIRNGVAVREAMALKKNLFEYAPKSKPAQDYQELYNIIMEG